MAPGMASSLSWGEGGVSGLRLNYIILIQDFRCLPQSTSESLLADCVVPRCPLLGSVCSLAFPPCAKSMVGRAPGRVPLPGLLWLRVSVLSAAVLAPTRPSRYAFSARSNLDPTVSCDVTQRILRTFSQTSGGQRGKRERKGDNRLGSTNLSAPKRQKKTKIECLRVTSLNKN